MGIVLTLVLFAGTHSALLKWHASKSDGVVYRVYRSIVPGGPYDRIASGITKLRYQDMTVKTGHIYYYVVNCRDPKTDLVSKNSNEVKATIP